MEKLRVDFRKLNPLMYEILTNLGIALNHRHNFKKTPKDESELLNFLKHQLIIYGSTHNSIHTLIKHAIRQRYLPAVADAASLVREQIEKVFIIALVLSDPHHWIKQALRGSFRTDYEDYLLQLDEHSNNPRYQEFLLNEYPKYFEKLQRFPRSRGRKETIISDYSRRVLEYNWENPRGRNPPWFKPIPRVKVRNVREYIKYYFEFPTPGKAATLITNKEIRKFLFRWHKDYSYICQYSHVAMGKSLLPVLNRIKHRDVAIQTKDIARNLMERIIIMSFTSTASSCTFIVSKLRDSYGAKPLLKEFWAELDAFALLSRAYWNMYPKKILS
jgi:hypothetical protein